MPVLNALKVHESYFSMPVEVLDIDGIEKAEEKLVSQGQILLKAVWEEVKAGELTYKISFASFIFLSAALIVALVTLAFVHS